MTSPAPCAGLAHVPGRVVFLAAMAAQMPEEEGAAAVMLVNDLAAVDPDLPLRALQAALGTDGANPPGLGVTLPTTGSPAFCV